MEGQGEASFGPLKLKASARFVKAGINNTDSTAKLFYEGSTEVPINVGVFSEIHEAT